MTVDGGLAEFSIVPDGNHHYAVKIGEKRLFDLVEQGGSLLAEYKPKNQGTKIQANLFDLLMQLSLRINPKAVPLWNVPPVGHEKK